MQKRPDGQKNHWATPTVAVTKPTCVVVFITGVQHKADDQACPCFNWHLSLIL